MIEHGVVRSLTMAVTLLVTTAVAVGCGRAERRDATTSEAQPAAAALPGAAAQPAAPRPEAAPLPDGGYAAEITVASPPARLEAGSFVGLEVGVKNTGTATWSSLARPEGAGEIRLAYHWLSDGGEMLVKDGRRTRLTRDLAPGEQVVLKAEVRVPDGRGTHILELDMVHERVTWFARQGSPTTRLSVVVE